MRRLSYVKIFQVQIHATSSKDSNEQQIVPSYIPSIEFPEIMSITAGPESFLLGLRSTTKTCPNCAIAKTLMKDLIEKDDFKNKRITDLEEEVRDLKVKTIECMKISFFLSFLLSFFLSCFLSFSFYLSFFWITVAESFILSVLIIDYSSTVRRS